MYDVPIPFKSLITLPEVLLETLKPVEVSERPWEERDSFATAM